jgi:hypothetical protein
MVACAYNPWEAEAEGLLVEASLGYIVRPFLVCFAVLGIDLRAS